MRARKLTSLTASFVLLVWTVPAISRGGDAPDPELLFEPSDTCLGCHSGTTSQSGEDTSIGARWRSTVMAHSARDPYWQATVRRETLEHPAARAAIEDKCSTCHMPMARFAARQVGARGEVLSRLNGGLLDIGTRQGALAEDGVSCTVCHQLEPSTLADPARFGGGFLVDVQKAPGDRPLYGPFAVGEGEATVMRSASGFVPTRSEHMREAALCAGCHTLFTHALDEQGHERAELAEQVPYLEWKHSAYAASRSCQACHMEEESGATPVSSTVGPPRHPVRRHLFRGGNFMLLRMLGAGQQELGVRATAAELTENRRSIEEYLRSASADLAIELEPTPPGGDALAFGVVVSSRAGHKLPTAYPSRRAWLHVVVRDGSGQTLFESGALKPDGSIDGNDNDADPLAYEPHYDEIGAPGQVQIYEAVMGDLKGAVTTGLLNAASYLKDNRLLPEGFDKTTASREVAVFGAALQDPTFVAGRDRVRYRLPAGTARGPIAITAELWYQPIGYRWAENLAKVDAAEPRRFTKLFRSVPGAKTAVRLAEARATLAR